MLEGKKNMLVCIVFYLALPECCLDHIIPILIKQDILQLGVTDKLKDDLCTHWLPCFFQAFLNHVAAALLHRQISIATLKLVQNFIRCPSNLEIEYELYYIVPAVVYSYA